MSQWTDDVWETSDLEANGRRDLLVTARIATAPMWPFLASSEDREDFANRLELVRPRLASTLEKISSEPAFLQTVEGAFVGDFETILKIRQAQAEPLQVEAVLQVEGASMTAMHYNLIASALHDYQQRTGATGLGEHFAGALAGTNPNFDRGRFARAANEGTGIGRIGKAPMTRQHFQAIADAIKSGPAEHQSALANHFAGVLPSTNSGFNRDRFLKAATSAKAPAPQPQPVQKTAGGQKSARDLQEGDHIVCSGGAGHETPLGRVDATTTPGTVYAWHEGSPWQGADHVWNHGDPVKLRDSTNPLYHEGAKFYGSQTLRVAARSDDIVGYSYRAEQHHPHCLIEDMVRNHELSPAARDMHPEDALDQHAGANGIDRYSESSYDSSEHPKTIFRDQAHGDDTCDSCGEPLDDAWMPRRASLHVARELRCKKCGQEVTGRADKGGYGDCSKGGQHEPEWGPDKEASLQVQAATYAEEQAAIRAARPVTHTFEPIGWDNWDARPHPGSSTIAPGAKVKYHGYMSPRGPGGMRLVHIEDESGNHQTVDKRSIKRIPGTRDPNPPKDTFRRGSLNKEAVPVNTKTCPNCANDNMHQETEQSERCPSCGYSRKTARRRMYQGQPACPLCHSGPDTEEHFRNVHEEEPDAGPKYNRPELRNNYTYWGDYDEAGNAVGTGTGRSGRTPKAASRREAAIIQFYGFLDEEGDDDNDIQASAAVEVSPEEVEEARTVATAATREGAHNHFEDDYDAGLACTHKGCNATFYTASKRAEHLEKVHGQKPQQKAASAGPVRRLLQRRTAANEKNLKEACPVCGKEIPSSEMAAHMKKEHPHQAIKPDDAKRGEEAEAKEAEGKERREKRRPPDRRHREGAFTDTSSNPFTPNEDGTNQGAGGVPPTQDVSANTQTPSLDPRAAHKLMVIAADLKVLNPGLADAEADRLALATLARYPAIAVEARGGADYIDGENLVSCPQCGKDAYAPASSHCHNCGYIAAPGAVV